MWLFDGFSDWSSEYGDVREVRGDDLKIDVTNEIRSLAEASYEGSSLIVGDLVSWRQMFGHAT